MRPGIALRTLASYLALAVAIASLAWLDRRLEAVPSVRLEAWDEGSHPLVVLDAGHGGHDGGAVAGGEIEKNLALTLTLQVRDHLRAAGVRVKLTRDKDVFLPLEERAAVAEREGAAAFVSLHLNTSASPEVGGIETYFSEKKPLKAGRTLQMKWGLASPVVTDRRGRWLADCIQKEACLATKAADRGIKERSYVVVSQSTVPAALVECGFLTHAPEARNLKEAAYQKTLTQAVATGILRFLKARARFPEQGLVAEQRPAAAEQAETQGAEP